MTAGIRQMTADDEHQPQPRENSMASPSDSERHRNPSNGAQTDADQPANSKPKLKQQAISAKRGRPEFEDFLQSIQNLILDGETKRSISVLIKLLRAGFASTPLAEHIEKIAASLKGWGNVALFGLHLTVEVKAKKSPQLLRQLRHRIHQDVCDELQYPTINTTGSKTGLGERLDQVLIWIERQFPKLIRPDVDANQSCPKLASQMLLCLACEAEPLVRSEALYAFLDGLRRGVASSKSDNGESTDRLIAELTKSFGIERIDVSKISSGLRFAAPARGCLQEVNRELVRQQSLTLESNREIARLASERTALIGELESANGKVAQLEEEARNAEQRLREAHDQYQQLDHFWEETCRDRLAKQAHAVRRDLIHEIREARIALNDASLNLPMVAERLSRMENVLSKLKEET